MVLLCSVFPIHWHPVAACVCFKTLRLGSKTPKCSPSQLHGNRQVSHVARHYLTVTHRTTFFTLMLICSSIRTCLFFSDNAILLWASLDKDAKCSKWKCKLIYPELCAAVEFETGSQSARLYCSSGARSGTLDMERGSADHSASERWCDSTHLTPKTYTRDSTHQQVPHEYLCGFIIHI